MNFLKRCYTSRVRAEAVQPDPKRFTVIDQLFVNGNTVARVCYANCTNYEGMKIIVCRGRLDLKHFKEIDPHFTPGGMVFARFEPTDAGWAAAVHVADNLVRKGETPLLEVT